MPMAVNKVPLSSRIIAKVMSTFNIGGVNDVKKSIGGLGYRDIPLPFNSYVQMTGSSEKTPLYRWSYSWVMDLFYGSDILRTIVKAINDEVFKNGIIVTERFVSKCTNPNCGYEMFEDIKTCPICGSLTRPPDQSQRMRVEQFIKRHNRFDESFINTLKITDLDIDIFDNGFILLTKRYYYDNEGNIEGAAIEDMVRLSPDKVKLVISNYGMGRGDTGTFTYVCPEHREKIVIESQEGNYFCDVDHKELIRCWYAANPSGSAGSGATGQNIYFGKDELYHLKRWTSTEGYGVSNVYTVWRKVLALTKMDDYVLEAYSLERSPRSFFVMRGKLDNIRQAWEWLMQKARENPNMVYPLVVEGEDTGARKIVETVDLNLKPDEMQMLDMVELFRSHIGLVYGVQPIISNSGTGGGGGLNNEGLQVTVTNRTIQESQRVWNDFLDWIASLLNAEDFVIKLKPNELEDEMRKLEMEQTRIDEASSMAKLGFDVDMEIDKDGMMKFRFKKITSSVGEEAMMDGGGEMPQQGEVPPNEGEEQSNAEVQENGEKQ